jgi:DNA-binding transcriptional MocR family regulator
MRYRMNVYFPPELLKQIADLADRKKLSRSAVVEAAVASFLSPDGADRREAAFARRLDRLSRQVQRLERNTAIAIETLALFVSFWLTITPPLPADAQAAAQVKGRERYEGFVEALGRRLQKGQSLLQEIPEDVDNHSPPAADAPESEPLDRGGPGSSEG